jgi:hypothetical protein
VSLVSQIQSWLVQNLHLLDQHQQYLLVYQEVLRMFKRAKNDLMPFLFKRISALRVCVDVMPDHALPFPSESTVTLHSFSKQFVHSPETPSLQDLLIFSSLRNLVGTRFKNSKTTLEMCRSSLQQIASRFQVVIDNFQG